MFRANFQRTGFYPEGEIRQLPKIKWQSQKSPEISPRFSGLTVAEGSVCVYSSDRNLYGLYTETGIQICTLKFVDNCDCRGIYMYCLLRML